MRRAFIMSASILGIGFGLAFVLLTAQTAALYGITFDPAGLWMARLFGVELIGLGTISWLMRNVPAGAAFNAALTGNLVAGVAGMIVSIGIILAGIGNAFMWSTVAVYAYLAAGCAYFLLAGLRHASHDTPALKGT